MRKNNPFLIGTMVLTLTGFATRIIGFFYRIFLSKAFGEEGVGIYQLIAPVMALVFSLCAAGIQTSISKHVASETSTKDYRSSFHVLITGLFWSTSLSIICSIIVYQGSDFIATQFIFEKRTAPLLRILALSFPLSSIHSCINGYYYGLRKTKIPAITQFMEQIVRVSCVYFLYLLSQSGTYKLTIGCAVLGLVTGELCSMIISLAAIYSRFYKVRYSLQRPTKNQYTTATQKILSMAIPLSLNRIVINFLASIEAIYIPQKLLAHGLTVEESLSIYGVLTGMALPLILFPSALTNSVGVLLLPVVSEAQSNGNNRKITLAVQKSILFCLLLGFSCTVFFILTGNWAGKFLFSSTMAGKFIVTLSFICPFLYLSSTLSSILHGLGKTKITFIFNVISLSIRLVFVFFLIPTFGILGYLWGILISQLIFCLLNIIALRKYIIIKHMKFKNI